MSDKPLFDRFGRIVQSGRIIFREGEIGEHLFIIQDGKVRISKNIGGKEHILAIMQKGDFFGEMAIVSKIRRTASAMAVGNVKLLALNRAGFQRMIEQNSKIAINIIDKLCKRLQHTNLQIQYLVKGNVESLVALNLYYSFSEQEGEEPVIAYDRTVEEISLNLEIPANKVSAEIENFKRMQVIDVRTNSIVLLDREKLTAYAETPEKKQS